MKIIEDMDIKKIVSMSIFIPLTALASTRYRIDNSSNYIIISESLSSCFEDKKKQEILNTVIPQGKITVSDFLDRLSSIKEYITLDDVILITSLSTDELGYFFHITNAFKIMTKKSSEVV